MTRKICILFLLGSCLLLADDTSQETLGLRNGRFWNSLPPDAQPFFLMGLLEGWKVRQQRVGVLTKNEALAFYTKTTFTYGDIGDMVTSVYRDPENLNLPMGWVIMACHAVQRGDTTRDAVFMALRRALSDEVTRKDPHRANELDPMDVIMNSRPK